RLSLCRSVHHDSVWPLFNDLKSKSLVQTQDWFASHEAHRDRRVIRICAHQLRQQGRADAMPAVLRFHRYCKLRRCIRFVRRSSEPGCAQQSPIFLVVRNESSVAAAPPAFHVTGDLWAAYDIASRRFLFFSGGQAVIQHLPKNGFILGCKLANYVVHPIPKQCFIIAGTREHETTERASVLRSGYVRLDEHHITQIFPAKHFKKSELTSI